MEKLIKIDRHEAKNTGAYTRWKLPNEAKLVYTTKTEKKTHWFEYYLVPEGARLEKIRRSNRGNITITPYYAEELQVFGDEYYTIKKLLELEGKKIE
jgi:hypothetical protein